jgi:anti-sigma regulatory factor (Ser/Thr protein kinase)
MVWKLPAEAASIPEARHHLVDFLHGRGWTDERIDDAALMTTELASNALTHAHSPFTVTADVSTRRLRVGVHDASSLPPVAVRGTSPTVLRGRGLAFVAALADRWGYDPDASGKTVWFETRTSRAVAPA